MDFAGAYQWVITHGYWLIFLAMLIEGPIVTAAAAFAAALGVFELWVILFLSIAADLVADVVYYLIGYWSHLALFGGFGRKLGLKPEKLESFKKTLVKHAGKVMTAIKLVPAAAPAGLTMIGAVRFPIRKYTFISLVITIPKTLFFLLIGYYFGAIYDRVAIYFSYGNYILIAMVPLFIIIYIGYRRWGRRFGNKIDSDHTE